MYERMLNKARQPAFEEMLNYCGESGAAWVALDSFLQEQYDLTKLIRFPYGKDYGWSVKYSQKSKHICDIFAEAGAFTVFFKLDNKDIESIKGSLSGYSLKVWDNKYPCGDGGWLRYRVTEAAQLDDVQRLLLVKVKPKNKALPLSGGEN